jgi:GT2 family glycosyltransferase
LTPNQRIGPGEISVVIPTIGRPALLERSLESLGACDPPPDEVLVVDQSEGAVSAEVTGRFSPMARIVASAGRGRGLAVNEGLWAAAHEIVLVVDDDCTVHADWVAVARASMLEVPAGIITGKVLPGGSDPRAVPSTITRDEPIEYTGTLQPGVLYGGNMGCPRDAVLEIGGFDDRILPSAEDCDFCYRWLRAGRRMRYIPELVVVHHDWRTREELERLYVDYHRGMGMFYAKHLRDRDLTMLRFMAGDYYAGFKSLYSSLFRADQSWADPRRGVIAGMAQGFRAGWRQFGAKRLRK